MTVVTMRVQEIAAAIRRHDYAVPMTVESLGWNESLLPEVGEVT